MTAHTMRVEADFEGLLGLATDANIHCCTSTPGELHAALAVKTKTSLPGESIEPYDTTIDMTLTLSYDAAFIGDGTPAAAERVLLAGVEQGTAYFNILTDIFPSGEIRGFLVAVPEPATLGILGLGLVGAAFARRRCNG
jgi:hypothetical protein